MYLSVWLLLAYVLFNVFVTSALPKIQYTPEIQIQSGRLRGFVETLPATKAKVRKYLGITYARANRFEKPVDPNAWKGVKNMTSFGKVCYQIKRPGSPFEYQVKDMSEDCLNLNIYVPDNQNSSKLPVMVWIHGGSFLANSNRISDGSYLATIGQVIVVTINYRLSVLGFLHAKDYGIKGNYGLYDQLKAFEWVQTNIQKFGGNPKQVTIFGNSAGGSSMLFQSLSPKSKGLFKNVIIQSAVYHKGYSYAEYDNKTTMDTHFKKFKCSGPNVIACVKALPALTLINDGNYATPVIDGEFLPDKPEILIKSGAINPKNILIGAADADGSCLTDAILELSNGGIKIFSSLIVRNQKSLQNTLASFSDLNRHDTGDPLYAPAVVCKYSTPSTDFKDPNTNRDIILDVVTDSIFIVPAVVYANGFAGRGIKTFFFYVKYALPMPDLFKIPPSMDSYHESEKFMVFGFALKNPDQRCSIGATLSRKMIKMWTNFAKTGDPNTPDSISYVHWPQYDLKSKQYLIVKPMLEVQSNVLPDFVKFWEQDVLSLNTTISQICKASGLSVPPKPMPKPPAMPNNKPTGLF